MNKKIKTTPLKKVAEYSNKKIECKELNSSCFIGTDNLEQNKLGKKVALYTQTEGSVTKYDEGDILVGNIRPYLKKIWYADSTGGSSADVLVFVVKNNFDSNFVYYNLFRDDFFNHMMVGSKGSKMPRGDKKHILSFPIPDFPLPEQQKIAGVLSTLDAKIELNNKINTELEAMAKTLYDYWFVQFDFPDAKGKPYKRSGGKMLWSDELKREIPKGWEVNKIGDILYTSLGGTPSTTVKEYWEGGTISWLNSGEIANFPIIDSELKITEAAVKSSATELLPKGSVMLSITRHLRPSILAIDACANQSVVGIKEKGDIKCYFIYPYLQNEIPRLMAMRSGAQQPHINKDIVDESFILIPNKDSNILKLYNRKIGNLYDMILNNALQNQKLIELRDWLLPILITGQVVVE